MSVTYPTKPLVEAIEQATSPAELVAAVQALAAARLEAGVPALIAALGYNNPAVAMAAVEGLVQLGEVAVLPLLTQLDDYDYGARAYSIRALAAIADPRALELLLSAAVTDFAPSVRRAAAKGLGNLRWSRLPVEQIQPAQTQALEALLLVAQDPDWSIRYAAIAGLQALASSARVAAQILAHLSQAAQIEIDLTVQARIQLALQQLTGPSSTSPA